MTHVVLIKDTRPMVLARASGGRILLPLTTVGDLLGYNGGSARFPIGTDGQILMADSGELFGFKWETSGGGESAQIETDVTLVPGESVYIKTNGHLAKSKADANATKRCQGLVEIGAAPTFAATIRSHGILDVADWTAITGSASLTPNVPYYVSEATAGALTATAPTSGWITRIGTALSTTKMDINPEPPIKL